MQRPDVAQGFASWVEPSKFGDLVTADHFDNQFMDVTGKLASRSGCNCAIVIQDYATKYIEVYPLPSKAASYTKESFQHFLGPDVVPKMVHTDRSGELNASLEGAAILRCPLVLREVVLSAAAKELHSRKVLSTLEMFQ